MLVLTRKKGEKIIVGDNITITVLEVRGDQIQLGIQAPRDVSIHREEIYKEIQAENIRARASSSQNVQKFEELFKKKK